MMADVFAMVLSPVLFVDGRSQIVV